jgi:WD40 repeat protein
LSPATRPRCGPWPWRRTAGADGVVRLWQVATGSEWLRLKGQGQPFNAVAFTPDGTALAAASHDGTVHFWRTEGNPER